MVAPEQTPEGGLVALREVSRRLSDPLGLPTFFGRLSAGVAALVGARRAFFGRLRDDRWLEGALEGFGIDNEVLGQLRVPCHRGGSGLAEQIVYEDLVFHSVLGKDPRLEPYRGIIDTLGLEEVMAVCARRDGRHRHGRAHPAGQRAAGGALRTPPLRALRQPVELLLPQRLRAAHRRHRRRYLADARPRVMGAALELWGLRKDGHEFPVDVSLSPLTTDSGVLVVAAIRDVTARWRSDRAAASKMRELAGIASTDPLTGLPNRREFERLLALPRQDGFAILALDVDRLKTVNDVHGHEAGDAHLRAIAGALRTAMRDGDFVARTGGDEFAALLPDRNLKDAATVAERLRRAMYGVVVAHGFARISVGCAAGDSGADGVTVWGAADRALYDGKSQGRDRVAASSTAATGESPGRVWERTLTTMIAERGIRVVYQPIVELHDGSVFGYEALCRACGERATAPVEERFAAAERLGLHRDLDWLCRRVAVRDAHDLPAASLVFINVGVSALLDPLHGADQMLLLLRWGGLDPSRLVLEITERDAVRDVGRLQEVLGEYRRVGIRFALDDVGEGRSTFEVLSTAVPEFVKVSPAITRRADQPGARAVVRALVTFVTETGTLLVARASRQRRTSGGCSTSASGWGRASPSASPPSLRRRCTGAAWSTGGLAWDEGGRALSKCPVAEPAVICPGDAPPGTGPASGVKAGDAPPPASVGYLWRGSLSLTASTAPRALSVTSLTASFTFPVV